jgi:hypothetical protein
MTRRLHTIFSFIQSLYMILRSLPIPLESVFQARNPANDFRLRTVTIRKSTYGNRAEALDDYPPNQG